MSSSPLENSGLCWKCQGLLNSQYPEPFVVTESKETQRGSGQCRYVRTSDSVEATACNGCVLCLHLLSALEIPARTALAHLKSTIAGASTIMYEQAILISEGNPPCIELNVDPGNSVSGWTDNIEIKSLIQLFPEATTTPFANNGEVSANTSSNATWSVVDHWLSACSKSHTVCKGSMAAIQSLPSRIIDVGSGTPRLVVVTHTTPIAPYATISHCWGSYMPLRLMSRNIDEFKEEIPASKLSRSFRDAISITKRLGLKYIWIDSLCIVQDSATDWEIESALMSDVYSNSYCNIAAAHAADGTYGCFIGRNPDIVKPLKVSLNWGPSPGVYYPIQWLYWRKNVMETPLNTRAWVCQERYLAPRNLYFGATQVYWECCECSASETFPLGLPPGVSVISKGLDPHVDGARRQEWLGLSKASHLDSFALWDLIISTYSRGKLTHAADKLVALSGLAARMQKHTKSQYIAGMWRKHLAYQLLWTARGINWIMSKSPVETYTAPSWSWASMNGSIEDACVIRHADDREIILEILGVGVDLISDKNPFGQVKGGFLRLRCSLAKTGVRLEESSNNRGLFRLVIGGLRLGDAIMDSNHHEAAPAMFCDFHYLPVRYSAGYEEVNQCGVNMAVPRVAGIILQATNSETTKKFKRVGIFRVFASPERFQSACQQYSRELRQVDIYQSQPWGAKWEITIV